MIDVYPQTGRIGAGEQQQIKVKLSPGIPDVISEIFYVEVAHFQAEEFKISSQGI